VYVWTGNAYGPVSSQYERYYTKQLETLNKRIVADAAADERTQAPKLSQTCPKAKVGKAERVLGSRDAGLTDAIKWSESDDPQVRIFASYVLSDIGTPDAIRYLRTLSHDPDPRVAKFGKELLESPGWQMPPTIRGEPLTKQAP